MSPRTRRALGAVISVAGCAAALWVLWWSITNGRAEQRDQPGVYLGAAPLVGRDRTDGWDWRFGWGLVGAGAVAVAVVIATSTTWWVRLRARWVLLCTASSAMVFATMLALTDGLDGLRYGAAHETEYLAGLPALPPAGQFVREFVDQIDGYSVHVRGHPPGFVLVLKALDALGLRGVWPVVALTIVSCGVLAAAVLVTVRSVAGEVWMRRSAPFLVVSPAAIWMITSGDTVFAAVGALGVAALAEGAGRSRRWATGLGIVGGLLLGSLLYLTYLGAVFLVIPGTVAVAAMVRRRPGAVAATIAATAAGLAVVGGFWWAGFWWFDGVDVTRREYREGSAQFREWSYFRWGNIGAALFALGPSTVAGLTRLRDRRMWLLVGSASVALLISHRSMYTKAEVERIWLLFFPWLVIAGAALACSPRRWLSRSAIGLQAASAIVLQAALVTKW